MIVDRDIAKYVVPSGLSIGDAIRHVIENKGRICLVSAEGELEGLLTNGDILRWVADATTVDQGRDVLTIASREFVSAEVGESPERIMELLQEVRFVPLTDARGRLVAVARERIADEGIPIGDHVISETAPTYVIAEIGINHNGSYERAARLVDEAARAGADCAKFQLRDLSALYANAGDSDDPAENLGSQYTLDLLSRFQLSTEDMFRLFDRCTERGLFPLCTPWDHQSLAVLESYGMQAYKSASADLTNHALLAAMAATGKPLICSTGMSSEEEIVSAVSLLNRAGARFVLLHCNSCYPAPYKDVHLRYLDRLKEIGGCPVGYSSHERGLHVPVAAVSLGAKVVEKHFTLDRSLEGNDHKVSLLPDEFAEMVAQIRDVEASLGSHGERHFSQGEMMNRVTLAKSLVAARDIGMGDIIQPAMITVKSPGRGLQPNRRKELEGMTARRALQAGDFFYPSDLESEAMQARHYAFRRPWGLPVRFHDFQSLLSRSNPDFLEFHLSYKDMEEDLRPYLDREHDLGLVVHSPDTFRGDHLLNLCEEDPDRRQRSIAELQRVVDLTRRLKPHFTGADTPFIVASVGGCTRDRHLAPEERPALYERLAESLAQVDTDGVEILPQTLPPFPWYFGGQLYLNVFVDATDTAEFCRTTGYRTCLDVSHAKLACTYHHWSFKTYVDALGPHVAHLHIADARGVDGEGVQVGEGEIDFPALGSDLDRAAPGVPFIPEIWHGHENDGEGFWVALDRLEGLL